MSKVESLFGLSLPFGAHRSNLGEDGRPINNIASLGLCHSDRNFFAKFRETSLLQLLAFFEHPQPLANGLALWLVVPGFEHLGNKFVEGRTKGNVHIRTLAQPSTTDKERKEAKE